MYHSLFFLSLSNRHMANFDIIHSRPHITKDCLRFSEKRKNAGNQSLSLSLSNKMRELTNPKELIKHKSQNVKFVFIA
jgi:hypothetical protein